MKRKSLGVRLRRVKGSGRAGYTTIVHAVRAQIHGHDILLHARYWSYEGKCLKKAFAGEMAPQDPNDESAAELLARVRAERAAAASTHKFRQRSTPREKLV